jgi:hypothetical protein
LGDSAIESDEIFFVNLSGATNASIADGQASGVIVNDDAGAGPSVSIGDTVVVEGDSGTATAVFTVTLSSQSSQSVSVDFATANGSAQAPLDYEATSGTLVFAPGITSRTISVPVRSDTTAEGNEQFFVNLSNPANATIADEQGVATISNDDDGQSPGTGNCSVINARGVLQILGDNSGNFIQVSDNGNGSVTVSTDCGVNESFDGVTRLHVIAGGGDDSVDYFFAGSPSTSRWITLDLGDGDDVASFVANGVTISRNLQVRVNGDEGADRIAAGIDAVLERSKTPLGLVFDGGSGADDVEANVRLRGGSARGALRVIGGDSDDDITLNLDAPNSVTRRLKAQLDGGKGEDACTAGGSVKARRC